MARERAWRAAPFGLLALIACGSPAGAPDAAPLATLSADSVTMAEVFELRVRVGVSPGSVVYFPDTVAASADLESFAPVEWRAERGPDGGATLTLTYPLIPFGVGVVQVPGIGVLTLPAESEKDGERVPGGSVVGVWADAPTGGRATINTTRVSGLDVWVAPVHTDADIVRGVAPRPPDDVLGLGFSWPAVALILLFSSVVGGAALTTTRDWLASRPSPGGVPQAAPLTLEKARLHAVAELDRLLAAGPHPEERALSLHSSSSGIVRDYVVRLDPGWGPALTSTELMGRLDGSANASPEAVQEMSRAERVKFGRLRPGAAASEHHLRTLRAWLTDADEVEA